MSIVAVKVPKDRVGYSFDWMWKNFIEFIEVDGRKKTASERKTAALSHNDIIYIKGYKCPFKIHFILFHNSSIFAFEISCEYLSQKELREAFLLVQVVQDEI